MSKTALEFIFRLVLLILAQAVIFNHLVIAGVAVAFVFVYAIVSMPVTWHTNVSVAVGFLTGLCVDIFSDTLGVNTLACTVLAFVRKPEFHLYMQSDEDLSAQRPSIRTMGAFPYMKYLVTMTVTYCLCYFVIDSFAFFDLPRMLVSIVASAVYTFVVIYSIDSIFTHTNEKRL